MTIPTQRKPNIEPKPTVNESERWPRRPLVIRFFAPNHQAQRQNEQEEAMNLLPQMAM
ncbi:DUF4174 domain-containing protein [Legionella rowbothamii]|uniref:DUF4174 domain-containing protein n=1 Tax=Legionella rowbothamii TaxID=96229 RepID=UPI0013EF640C|nr:DUF4174 domain-containing protein [Legionella rowbothamii]